MKVALISLNQIWESKEVNKKKCRDFIAKSFNDNADLIIFPEMTLTGFSMNIGLTAEDISNAESISWFKENAKIYKLNIVFGYVQKKDKKAFNNLLFLSQYGEIICSF